MGVLDENLPALAMIGLQFHYAALAIFTRAALVEGLSPTVFVVYRQAIATLALAPMVFSPNRIQSFKASLSSKSFFLMFATSLIGVTANQNAYFQGLFYASSTAATAMSNLIPALTFVIATLVGFEKIDLKSMRSLAKIGGTVCCVSGALTMALLKGHKLLNMDYFPNHAAKHILTATTAADDTWLLGCLLLLASSVFWSSWIIMQVPISSRCPDHLLSTFWMCLFAAVQSAIFALVYEQDLKPWSLHSGLEVSCCLYAGIGIAVSFLIQTWCISERGPLYCAMFNPLATVITAFISTTFLQEQLYVGSLIGAIGVIIGLYIVLWGKAKEYEGMKQKRRQSNLEEGDDDENVIRSTNNGSSKIDLEEPLLTEKSESMIEP
ncbi:hypothetical protein PIB30_021760 [Stylosanthes scabra]|uniref:WAT1-related protein n=1 Tax=Stylosanthes scabra TaxID=79078 RepID=A0ABU6UBP7_9FABA|nr:hypothetical protein [Stylosanthes scabra]